MYGLNNLKESIELTDDVVVCPVCSCDKKVTRQRNHFRVSKEFYCEEHRIFISPSAFAYEEEKDNLLWYSETDITLLNEVKKVKRESRLNYNNSEDALTWNVFRFLDNHKLLDLYFSKMLNREVSNIEVIYWSYSNDSRDKIFKPLKKAREIFEYGKGSEPDIILKSNEMVIFIEAKFGASNNVQKSNHYEALVQKYCLSENRLWDKLFTKNFETIAVKEKKYELARFWLLGNWIAEKYQSNSTGFSLINLVRDVAEKDIENKFTRLINQDESRVFKRITWESIYYFILEYASENASKKIITNYLVNRTLGYDEKGKLKKAFNI